ncbi:hypothetical protein C8J57DRAFT_1212295 [Mycena rebaudengoi]|nr:hypothetical protein C8J57DRAFT_1212295 [Mycena rebaudengoi]
MEDNYMSGMSSPSTYGGISIILRAEKEAFKDTYFELANAVPALLTATSNPYGLPVPQQSIQNGPAAAPKAALEQGDYPQVRFWNKSDYSKNAEGISNNTGQLGENTTMTHIEDTAGRVVDAAHLRVICGVAASIWFGLVESSLAPRKWGQASITVLTQYYREMCHHCPEMRYCANNWKAQQLATTNYPSWIRTRQMSPADIKQEDSEVSEAAANGQGDGDHKPPRDEDRDHKCRAPSCAGMRKKIKSNNTAMIAEVCNCFS